MARTTARATRSGGQRPRPATVVGCAATFEEGRLHHTRDDHCHPHAGSGQFRVQGAAEDRQRALGRAIDRLVRQAQAPRNRGHIHHAPAPAPPHAGQDRLGQRYWSAHVER